MAEKSFPLNNTDYGAEDAQLFFATRTRGVFAGDHLGVTPGEGMNVLLGPGIGWLKNGDFGGLVYANTEPLSLTIGMADPIYPRVDRAVVRHDVQQNSVYSYVKQGVPASSPVPAELERSSIADEISVAQVYVEAGATAIGAGNITDERLNMAVCGLMRDGVTGIDTSVIEAQWQELLSRLTYLLDEETIADFQNKITANETAIQANKEAIAESFTGIDMFEMNTSVTTDRFETVYSGFYSFTLTNSRVTKNTIVMYGTTGSGTGYDTSKNTHDANVRLAYVGDGYIKFTATAKKDVYLWLRCINLKKNSN